MSVLATDEGVSVLLVMLVVGLIFLTVIALGELTHAFNNRRKQRRRARRPSY
jgi:arginine exporter protein ArgO